MYIPLRLLCLLWWSCIVLGSFQVLVQTPSTTFKPGDTISYTLVADPIPSGALGMMLIPVQEGNVATARPYTPFSATMAFSPQQFTVQIPTSLTLHSFYTIDAHVNSSVFSPLLGYSEPIEIVTTSPSSGPPIVKTVDSVTETTVIKSTTQSPSVATTTSTTALQSTSSNSNPPSSSTSTSSANSQSSSEEPATTTSNSAAGSVTPSISSSADGSAISHAPKSKSAPVGAIVGGVVGGILVIILLLTFLLCRRRRRQRHQRDVVDTTNSSAVMVQQGSTTLLNGLYAQRPFVPNRSLPEMSPFLTNSDSHDGSLSPALSSAKSREVLGLFGAAPGHIPGQPSASLSRESTAGRVVSQDMLRSERERILSEISALRTGTTTGATFANTVTASTPGAAQPSWSGSPASAVGSDEDRDGASEMRERLEQLTNHVRRLESALEQVAHSYDAPPVYDELRRSSRM